MDFISTSSNANGSSCVIRAFSPSKPSTFEGDDRHRFLHACNLCNKPFSKDKDIFMYRDRAFCSVECRQVRMDTDGAEEEEWNSGKARKGKTDRAKYCLFHGAVGIFCRCARQLAVLLV
ncbi:FCS-Like Zinc finger 3-like [Magnolia sinica]|uniref:FCS-Like Zinc finger 3-like n=1 Tax=Magnolia sinica TaxID=86752 RepID=UPI00265B5FB6|nr:FCS-Like Zinc finger 3-like [Magnolia sinica]